MYSKSHLCLEDNITNQYLKIFLNAYENEVVVVVTGSSGCGSRNGTL